MGRPHLAECAVCGCHGNHIETTDVPGTLTTTMVTLLQARPDANAEQVQDNQVQDNHPEPVEPQMIKSLPIFKMVPKIAI